MKYRATYSNSKRKVDLKNLLKWLYESKAKKERIKKELIEFGLPITVGVLIGNIGAFEEVIAKVEEELGVVSKYNVL